MLHSIIIKNILHDIYNLEYDIHTIMFSIYNNCYSFDREDDVIDKNILKDEVELKPVFIPPEIIKSTTLKDENIYNRKNRFSSEEWEII